MSRLKNQSEKKKKKSHKLTNKLRLFKIDLGELHFKTPEKPTGFAHIRLLNMDRLRSSGFSATSCETFE